MLQTLFSLLADLSAHFCLFAKETVSMGGAASVDETSPNISLINFTNREQFLKDCNLFFDTIQSSDGTASKSRIYSVLNGLHKASEILNIFMLYCPEGLMSSGRFVDICRDLKLLDKAFTISSANDVYEAGRESYYNGQNENVAENINFAGFLYHIVPHLAFAKNIDPDILTDRIARHHLPSPTVERMISFKRTLSEVKSPVKKLISKLSFNSSVEPTTDEKRELLAATQYCVSLHHIKDVVHQTFEGLDMDIAIKNQAATKIQSKFRSRIAKRKAYNLKQLKKGKRVKDCSINPKIKPKTEQTLRKVFQFYCPNDDIDLEGFFALLKDSRILGPKYLGVDVEYNFKETIAKVELSDTPRKYTPGVRFHKRFTFMVFKEIALCFVALSTGLSYDAIVDTIIKNCDDE